MSNQDQKIYCGSGVEKFRWWIGRDISLFIRHPKRT